MAEQSDSPIRGSGFNTDPQTGDWDQLAFENHSLIERVRGESTDTDDAFAIYVQGVSTTTKVFNVLKTGAIWAGSSNAAVLGSSPNVTFGTAVAGGSSTFALRQDATLLLYDGTNPLPVGSVATTGSSSLAPRRDHVHLGVASVEATGATPLYGAVDFVAGAGVGITQTGQGITIMASTAIPAGASAGTPALVLGTTNAAGGSTFIGVSSTIQLYDSTNPSTWAFGTAAAVGGGSFAARSNHAHAVPSLAAPALVFGTAASVGSSNVPFGSDARVVLYTATMTATVALGNLTGVSNFASREDHVHGIGGLATRLVVTIAEWTGDQATNSATFVNITSATIATNTSATNKCDYHLNLNCLNDAGGTHNGFRIDISAGTRIQESGWTCPAANYESPIIVEREQVDQATGSKTILGQFATNGGNLNSYNTLLSVGSHTAYLRHTEYR